MRYIISAGGTGGHIYPALSIIDKIKEDKDNLEKINRWETFVSDIDTLFELYEETKDESMLVEVDKTIKVLKAELETWEVESTLSGEYDG